MVTPVELRDDAGLAALRPSAEVGRHVTDNIYSAMGTKRGTSVSS